MLKITYNSAPFAKLPCKQRKYFSGRRCRLLQADSLILPAKCVQYENHTDFLKEVPLQHADMNIEIFENFHDYSHSLN